MKGTGDDEVGETGRTLLVFFMGSWRTTRLRGASGDVSGDVSGVRGDMSKSLLAVLLVRGVVGGKAELVVTRGRVGVKYMGLLVVENRNSWRAGDDEARVVEAF